MPSWGNEGEDQFGQTMDSNGEKLIVSRDENDSAIQAVNTNAGASARALKVTGKTEIVGDVDLDGRNTATWNGNLQPTLHLTNDCGEGGGVALEADGRVTVINNANEITTHLTNTDAGANTPS